MMRKTIVPVLHELLNGPLEPFKNKFGIFDRDYCNEMRDLKYYKPIMEEPYDSYRDLHRIFKDPILANKGYSEETTLLIDSDSRKVQLWLDNTMIDEPFTREDVAKIPTALGKPGEEPFVRSTEWQISYVQELTYAILAVVEGADVGGVPAYL